MTQPFAGVRVVELAGIGPGPFIGMMLNDFGAEVVRIERLEAVGAEHPLMGPAKSDVMNRGKRSVALDLKEPAGLQLALALMERSDVLIDPFRPGVAERLGIGPDRCLERRPQLVYARVTGWGQDGPLAAHPGHDINYLARTGALAAIGSEVEPPPPPLNLVADFGGGGMFAAFGIAAALFERDRSGQGQVIDAAMVDGVSSLLASIHGFRAADRWQTKRQSNLLDGGAPFYRCYRTSDGQWVAVGALEPQFYSALLGRLGLDPKEWPQHDRAVWPDLTELLETLFAEASRSHWEEKFADGDACVTGVVGLAEARREPHLAARETIAELNSVAQPMPSPRLSRTPGRLPSPPPEPGEDTEALLTELGLSAGEVARLKESDVVRVAAENPQRGGKASR